MAWGPPLAAALIIAAAASPARPIATQDPDRIDAGTRLTRAIDTEPAHRYRIHVRDGSYVEIEVFQRGRDVAVELVAPDGAIVASTDTPLGGFGPELVAAVVEGGSAADYTVVVRPSRDDGPAGRYDLTVIALRAATADDRLTVKGVRQLQQGELARTRGTAATHREALALYQDALTIFAGLGDRPRETAARLGVARAHDNLGDKRAALDEYADVRRRFNALGDISNEAFTLNLAGLVHDFLGERDRAMPLLSEALELSRRAEDVRVEALSTGNTGLIYFQTGDRVRAGEWYTRALALHRRADNRRGEAVSLTNLGSTSDAIGEKDAALNYFQQALALRRLLGEPREEAVILNNMGVLYFSRDQYREALSLYEEALPAWRAAADKAGEAATLHNIASVNEFRGAYQEAIDLWSRALELQRATSYRIGEANTLANRGRLFLALGDYEQARTNLERSLALQRDVNSRNGEALTLINLASVHEAMGDRTRALALYEDSLTLMRAVSNRRGEASALQALGRVRMAMGDRVTAEANLQQAVTLYKATDGRIGEAVSTAHLGRLRVQGGDRAGGRALLTDALGVARSVGHLPTEAAVLLTIARLDRDSGDLPSADRSAQAALAIVEAQRSRVAIDELRSTYLARVRDYYELAVDVLIRMDDAEPGRGFASAALQVSERARARSLLDQLTYAQQDLRSTVDPNLRRQVEDVQATLNIKAERLRRLLASQHTQAEVDTRNSEIAALTGQYRELESRLKRSSTRYGAIVAGDAAPVAELQRALDSTTVLVEYMLGDERSFAWIMTRDSVRRAILPSRNVIEDAARRFARATSSPGDSAQAEAEKQLTDAIIAPIAPLLDRAQLVIVPDGALARVPFAALAIRRAGQPAVPLVVEHDIVTAPSASTVALLRADARPGPAAKILALFADPVYSPLDVRVTPPAVTAAKPAPASGVRSEPVEGALAATNAGELTRLIGARREATAIASLVPADTRQVSIDFAATREAATSAGLGDYRLLHFATHAIVDDVHPELSGIVLSLVDRQGRPQDGFLRLHEIYNLDLSADLVVLSACQTALGREIRGEGMIGLTRGFLHAGAKRVVATLWQVDDRATAELMQRFYAAMLGPERQSPRAALRTAQRAMLTQTRWKSPYYWAGFILYGEWQ